jgi:DNA invertase Pin-like site-specific DNA recombinase
MAKSRNVGTANGGAKLNESDVRAIQRQLADGVYQHEIAERFGVSTTLVSRINRGEVWRHVTPAWVSSLRKKKLGPPIVGERHGQAKVDEQGVQARIPPRRTA